jgi:ABC-2 type transport system permease protein
MNGVVARLTWRSLVGRRRAIVLVVLPAVLLLLSLVHRLVSGDSDPQAAADVLTAVALGFVVPLLCLIAGTGSIGPEIDDGSVVYLLAKPLSRHTIVQSKLAIAVVVSTLFGALPTLVAGLVLTGGTAHVAVGFAVGAFTAGVAYSAVFLLLAIVTRNAVVIGLIYALLWESLVGGYVPGAQALSIQQWSLAITQKVIGAPADSLGATSAVGLPASLVLLVVVIAGATWYAGWRLRSIRLTTEE